MRPNHLPLAVTLTLFAAVYGLPSASAQDIAECHTTSTMWDDVHAGGDSFRAYSNLAERPDGEKCMKWIVRNDPGRSSVRVEWYHKEQAAKTPIIQRAILPGCYQSAKCDCEAIPCQLQVETSPLYSDPIPTDTTIDFGVWGNRPEDKPQYTDNNVRARILEKLNGSSPNTQETLEDADDPSQPHRLPKAYPPPEDWHYGDFRTRVAGVTSTTTGDTISLDLVFASFAQQETENQFFVYNDIYDNTESGNIVLASTRAIGSGRLRPTADTITIAWTALETLRDPPVFAEPLASFPLNQLRERSNQPRESRAVGISDESRVKVLYKGEIVLEVNIPVYLSIQE